MAIIYALTKGYLDDIPVSDCLRFEAELFTYLESNNNELLEHIRTTGNLPEESDFKAAIEAFKKRFRSIE